LKDGAEGGLLAEKAARKGKGKRREEGEQGKKHVGMVEQSLHAELKKEMTEYFRLVTVLEAKLEEVESDDEEPTKQLEGLAAVGGLTGGLTLRKLDVWTQDVRLRMRMMGTLIAEVGGAFYFLLLLFPLQPN
jgi:gamma-tubulin complex component 3